MKFLSLFHGEEIHIAPHTKVIPANEYSKLIDADELIGKTNSEALQYREEVAKECEIAHEKAEASGFEAGQAQWSGQLEFLEREQERVRKELENATVPLALAAVKKIIGRELETKRETIVDIVATALRSVSQHRRITIYVSKSDLDLLEVNRPRIKDLFEHLESLSILSREDLEIGDCIIETEAGIINAQLENQLKALEMAFQAFFQNKKQKES